MAREFLLGTDPRTPIEIKRAVISHGSSGSNTIVSGVSGKRIRVMGVAIVVGGSVGVEFRSGGTGITGQMSFSGSGDGMVMGYNPLGWFETEQGESLNMQLSSAVNVGGVLQYIEV